MTDQRYLMTVRGAIPASEVGVADGHNHVWLAPVEGAQAGFTLDDEAAIAEELRAYCRAGGRTQIDCQPGGAGRDGRALCRLAVASGVHVVACTGFHLRKYYPADYWLWHASAISAYAYFSREINEALDETRASAAPVRAGFIKIAFEEDPLRTPTALLDALAQAALDTGVAIEIHTEKGAGAETILRLFAERQLSAGRLILCHMDKRPDAGLHRTLIASGAMLEYDTFFRPRYDPEHTVWPLLERLVADGCAGQIVIGTDQADPAMWQRLGHGHRLAGLLTKIIPRLSSIGFDDVTIARLVGGNVAERLARSTQGLKHA